MLERKGEGRTEEEYSRLFQEIRVKNVFLGFSPVVLKGFLPWGDRI